MKICIIHSIFPPYTRGGAEIVAYATAQGFAQAGHEVFVITCAPFEGWKSFAGQWKKEDRPLFTAKRGLSPFSLRIFRFTPFNLFTIFNIAKYPPLLRLLWHIIDMFNLHTYLVVRRILHEQSPDLIITRNLKGLGYTVPAAIRHHQKTMSQFRPSVRWFHGLHDLGALHPRGFMEWGKESAVRKPMPLVRLYRLAARWLFGSPDIIIAPSRFVLDEYERVVFFPNSKREVVSNPVFHQKAEDRRQKAEDRPQFSRFLYIGQLEPYKGIRVLLNAWKQFICECPDARLEIVGKGSMEAEIRRAERRTPGVWYHGFIAHHDLAAYLDGATATLFPTLAYESFGLTTIESFAAGVPVVASNIGAIPEIVRDGVNGILVTPGDVDALVRAMRTVIREGLSLRAGARRSAESFSLERYHAEIIRLYANCASVVKSFKT